MRRSGSGFPIAALLVGLGFTTACAEEREETSASLAQIALWIQQLDDDSFSLRDAASKRLLASGESAIEAVAAAAAGNSLEVTVRTIRILDEFAASAEAATANSAREALTELAASRHPAAAARARNVLRTFQQRIATALERCGARVQHSDGKIVAVNFDKAVTLGENLRLLRELPDLEYLSLSTPLMDDDGLAGLRGLPLLREVNLYRSRVGDDGLKHLASLPNLRRVPMGETQVTDRGLAHLKDLTQLEYVGLRGNQVTDAGLAHLQNLTNLTGLYLGETKVTDAGLVHLRPLTRLNLLRLDQTKVSDAGLEHLKVLTDLQSLDLSDTKVTESGVAELKQALPNVQIGLKRP